MFVKEATKKALTVTHLYLCFPILNNLQYFFVAYIQRLTNVVTDDTYILTVSPIYTVSYFYVSNG